MADPAKAHLGLTDSHLALRRVLRVVGPIVLLLGLTLFLLAPILAMTSSSFDGPPGWMFVATPIGVLLCPVGFALTMAGWGSAVARFHMREMSPVVKDTANYLGETTQPAVRAAASAIAEGLREGATAAGYCSACGDSLSAGDKFCDQCGSSVAE